MIHSPTESSQSIFKFQKTGRRIKLGTPRYFFTGLNANESPWEELTIPALAQGWLYVFIIFICIFLLIHHN